MEEYRTILDVQKEAFRLLLAYISLGRPQQEHFAGALTMRRNKLLREVPHLVDIIENAMRWHKTDVDVQRMGCRFLEMFLPKQAVEVPPNHSGDNTGFVFPETCRGMHLLHTVVAAMHLAPDNAELQQNACCAVALLCSVQEEKLNDPFCTVEYRRNAMASVAGVDTIKKLRKVMMDSATDAHLVMSACRAMSFLLVDATYDASLSGLDGVLIDAMRAHMGIPNILLFGSRALASFANVQTKFDQFRNSADCAQFVVNLVQISANPTVTEHAIATMEAVLRQKKQSMWRGTLTTQQTSEFTHWQQCFVKAGAIRVLVMTMDTISKDGTHPIYNTFAKLYTHERIQRSLALVLHTLFVLIDDSVYAKMKFLDADGPRMLMCVLSDFNFFELAHRQAHTTWGPRNLSRVGLVWQLFNLLSEEKNCTERQKCRLRAVCTFMHAGQWVPLREYLDLRSGSRADLQGLISPVQLAVSCLSRKASTSTQIACLWFLNCACSRAVACELMGLTIVEPMKTIMKLYQQPTALNSTQQAPMNLACIVLLHKVSIHVELTTDAELMDLVFMPVLPALREDMQFLVCLAKLQRTLANLLMRQAVIVSCCAIIKYAATVSAEDKIKAQTYYDHQNNSPFNSQTMTV